jgi:hypothetical protein
MSLSEKAQISLDRADEAEKSIGRLNTPLQGVVERVKLVMNTLAPVAGVRIINILFAYPRLSQLALSAQPNHTDGAWAAFNDPRGAPVCVLVEKTLILCLFGYQELAKQYELDDNVRTLLKSMHDAFNFATHEDILRSIEPKSKQAEILTLMLQDVCNGSDFIQSYTKDPQFCTLSLPASLANLNMQSLVRRMLKTMGSGVKEKIQELSTALVEHRKAFLEQAVISAVPGKPSVPRAARL